MLKPDGDSILTTLGQAVGSGVGQLSKWFIGGGIWNWLFPSFLNPFEKECIKKN